MADDSTGSDIGGVGAQTDDYAKQIAAINTRIDGLVKNATLPTGPDKDVYDGLVKQRASLSAKAKDLAGKTGRAGAKAPDLDEAVDKATPKPNPFAKYATPDSGNPFAKYAPAAPDAGADNDSDAALEAPPGPTTKDTAAIVQPESKDPYLGITFGGSKVTSSEVPPGPTWEEAQKTLLALDKEGVPSSDPRYKQALKDKALGLQRLTSNGQDIALGAGIGGGLIKGAEGAAKLVPKALGAADRLVSRGATKAAEEASTASEGIRSDIVSTASKNAAAKESEAAAAEKKAADIAKLQADIRARQPAIAAERAAAQAPGKVLAEGRAVSENPASVRAADVTQRSVEQRAAEAEARGKEERAAGASAQQAKEAVVEHEARVQAAEQAASKLDADLVARPTMTPDVFGERIRDAAQKLKSRLEGTRREEAKFGETLAAAGDTPRVNTSGIEDYIIQARKGSLNPNVQSILDKLQNMLAEHENKLTLAQADDLRKTISEWINTKAVAGTREGTTAVNSAATAALKPISKDLTRAAIQAWPDYGRALERYSTLSRPLNVLARNSGFGKILDRDPTTTAFKRDLSDVVGEVLKKTNKGNKALDALVQDSPELKDAARLYFSRQIFEGSPTTDAKLANFLKQNEGSLRKFGLYNEFKDIKAARASAKNAIAEATGARDQSLQEAKAAAKREAASREATETAKARVAKQRELPSTLAKAREKRATSVPEARKTDKGVVGKEKPSLEATRAEATGRAKKLREAADSYKQFVERTEKPETTPTEKVPAQAREFANKMRSDGLLTREQYQDYLVKVNKAEQTYKNAADKLAARKLLIKRLHGYAKTAIYLAGGYEALRVSGLTGLLP